MLRVAVYTPNAVTAQAIEQLIQESDRFELVGKGSPIGSAHEIIRTLRNHQDPELILLDLTEWEQVCEFADHLAVHRVPGVIIGFRPSWNRMQQLTFEESGILNLLQDPFSLADLEAAAYDALHRLHPIANHNVLAFLPAKAGGGCSTVALNTAAALAQGNKKVLLMECDRRSGVLSILLNLENPLGLPQALQNAGRLTPLEWRKHLVEESGVDLLLANPTQRAPLASWADYYQMLHFVQREYSFILADLPEVINQGTAEVVRCARAVFVVCEPQVPSLILAGVRCSELESCGIPAENVHIILNRWERDRFSLADVERILGRPVFAALPNDYRPVNDATMQSQLVSANSKFAESCRSLARKLTGGAQASPDRSKFTLLERLGRLAS